MMGTVAQVPCPAPSMTTRGIDSMTIPEDASAARSAATGDPDPFPGLMRRRRRALRLTTAAAVAVGLAVGGGAVAGAASSGPTSSSASGTRPAGRPGFGGTPPVAVGAVASLGSDSFTLTTRDKTTVTVKVSSSTSYLDPGVASPSLTDVKVGSHVAVFGTDASNSVTATKVAIGGPFGGPRNGAHGGFGGFGGTPPVAQGTVASVGTSSFTLTTRDKTTVTVDVGAATTYVEFGVSSPSLADVKVGTRVVVFGTDNANTVAATKVGIGNPSGGWRGPGAHGAPGAGGFGGDMRPPTAGSSSESSSSSSSSGSTVTT